jgi:hypothetical protein
LITTVKFCPFLGRKEDDAQYGADCLVEKPAEAGNYRVFYGTGNVMPVECKK